MRIVSTSEDLTQAVRRLSTSEYVAVDTEFLREQTFWPQLCLIQIASPEEAMIIDPMSPGLDLKPFWELMGDERVVKVFHAARQDIEIVYARAGMVPQPVFDTQVAAMVCGFGESVSYVNLVKNVTGVDIDKSSRFTDWSRRPLSDKQLEYALGDVTHLRDVYRHLRADIEKTDRFDWLNEEMGVLTDPKTYEIASRRGVAAAQAAGQEPQGAGRADGARRLARAPGAVAGRAALAHPARRGALRHRQPGADVGRAAQPTAHAERGLLALGAGARHRRGGEARARARHEDRAGRARAARSSRQNRRRWWSCCACC